MSRQKGSTEAIKAESTQIPELIRDDAKSRTFRVHSRVFTDNSIYELEFERVWNSSWVFLAHESQLKCTNDYLTTYIGRQPVILSRNENDSIRCFLNRCRHKGAMVCRSETGNSSRFRCLYHGWTYRNDGKLIGIPGPEGYDEKFDRESLNLAEVSRLGQYKGWIFASVCKSVPPLEEYLGNAKNFLDLIADKYPGGIEVYPGTMRFTMRGNWKLHADNSIDSYHPLFTHKSVMQVLGSLGRDNIQLRDRLPTIDLGQGHFAQLHTYEDSKDLFEGGSYSPSPDDLRKIHDPRRAKWATTIKGFHLYVFPNLVIFDQGPPSFEIRVITPLSVCETDLAFYTWGPTGCDAKIRERILRTFVSSTGPAGMVTIDDMEVMKAQTEGFSAGESPWLDFSRGMHREKQDYNIKEFVQYVTASPSTDDTMNRGFFRHWIKVMTQS